MSLRLSQSITYWLSRATSAMQDQFNRDLEAFDITWPQWMVLNVLHHSDHNTPAAIADEIGIDRSAITRLVDRLEGKGLVLRQHDQSDRRSIRVLITEPGKMILDMMDKAAADHQQDFMAKLAPHERSMLLDVLQKLTG